MQIDQWSNKIPSISESDLQKIKTLKLDETWSAACEYFRIEKLLGSGSYGKVVQATCKTTGKLVAIKFIQGIFKNEYDCVKMLREIKI